MTEYPSSPAIACYGLTKSYSSNLALAGVDLELPRGKIIGLLGPNGSGKTTLVKILAGLLQPTSGTVLVEGLAPGTETKAFVSYLPERSYFSPSMRVADCVSLFRDFYEDFDYEHAIHMLSVLGVPYKAKLKTLSKGTREKVQLVLVMARRAKLYLLDEPIGGVDPAAREYILNTILTARAPDSTILLSTHLIRDVEDILDGFAFLGGGQVIISGDTREVCTQHQKTLDEIFREVFRCC
ncbi:MAG: ABC transporter ATP-binding protein [Eubacteriales bacterium]